MNVSKIKKFTKVFCLASAITLAATVSLNPAYSQQIMLDGNTNTNLNIVGNKTTVTTKTNVNGNAFNSFKRFNVNAGKTVDVIVPGSVNHLINLVHNEKSLINGKLNFLQNGKIGGSVFFVNPHGIAVGAQGVINVQQMTAITPTVDFMKNFFVSRGNPDINAVDDLVNARMPVNAKAEFINEGKINAGHKLNVISGIATNYGFIDSNADFDYSNMNDIVNLNSLAKGINMKNQDGEISIIATDDVTIMGDVIANQNLDYNLNFESKEGNVNAFANMVGRVKAKAEKGDVNIIQYYKDLDVFEIEAKNDVRILAVNNIVDAKKSEDANIISKNISMYSVKGGIGNVGSDLNIQTDAKAGGKLYAYANDGEITIKQNKGDLAVDMVYSQQNVQLIANENILDGNVGESENVIGHDICLMSEHGDIGNVSEDLDISVNNGVKALNGTLTAFAPEGSVNIEDHSSYLTVNEVFAGKDVNLKAKGDITTGFISRMSGMTNIIGNNINLISGGNISSSWGELLIESNHKVPNVTPSTPGTLSAVANGNVSITQQYGDLYIDTVKAKTAVISSEGTIFNGKMTAWPNIDADDINLYSTYGGIGTANKPLRVKLNHAASGGDLRANAQGDIFIYGDGDLYLDTVKTKGDITLNATNIYSNAPTEINVDGADINITASGSIGKKLIPLNLRSTTANFNLNSNDINVIKIVPVSFPTFSSPFPEQNELKFTVIYPKP